MSGSVVIDRVDKRYAADSGDVVALEHIQASVGEGEFVCLLGPSGCGKSTLLRIVAGLIPASGGRVLIDSTPVQGCGPDRAFVFQEYALFPWMTVQDNVAFGLAARGVAPEEQRRRALELLKVVGLAQFAEKYPHHLSGGMKQRVSIARAFATDPEVLLMDEPFASLDEQTKLILQEELLRIWDETRKTVVYITHGIDEAVSLGDRVAVMTARPGRLKRMLAIDFKRPRNLADLRRDARFGERVYEIWNLLRDEVERSRPATATMAAP
jgi:NitT/TauT family transport system ATP-binding protein